MTMWTVETSWGAAIGWYMIKVYQFSDDGRKHLVAKFKKSEDAMDYVKWKIQQVLVH